MAEEHHHFFENNQDNKNPTAHCVLSLFKQIATLIFLPSYLFHQNKEMKGKVIVTASYVGLLVTIGCVMPVSIAKLSDKEFLELLHHACEKMHIVDESQQVINAFSDFPDILGGQEVATSLALVALCSVIYNILTSLLILPKLCCKDSENAEDPSDDIGIDPTLFFNQTTKKRSNSYSYVGSDSTSKNEGMCACLKHLSLWNKKVEEPSPQSRSELIENHESFPGLMEVNDRYDPIGYGGEGI